MSANPKPDRCPKCGAAELTPEGVCPACVMEGVLQPQDEGGELSEELGATLPPSFGDYEIIHEIARGGMGVVYKARQRSLNRVVAVKMILAGRLARKSDLQRFRAEAETAARLQHPNIVAIHEVGEFGGQPFFSMDYVEGKSLAELAHNEPLPAKRAAVYLKTIAEAVEYAHSKGVLHRDLKPSNILIDSNDQPRITDFGLAKRLDDYQQSTLNNQLTVTGQILGSPNFMPPEQAAGDRKSVGPASDVYSLGAILYQLLTGRPPFMAETITQTLRLVEETEPAAPSLLNPGAPRDLETICLKCLQKDCGRRYATAKELAEDLDRFLRDEPIQARPVGQVEKAWRWCRRHPAIAGLGALVLVLLVAVAVVSSLSAARLKSANQRATDKLFDAYVGQARAERWSGRAGRRLRGLELIKKAAEVRTPVELRNEAIACLALEDLHPVRQLKVAVGHEPYFDRDFARYAAVDDAGNVVIRRASDDRELVRLPGWSAGVWSAFSPDGHLLCVYCCPESPLTFRVYDLRSEQPILSRANLFVRNLDFSADSRELFVAVGNPSTIVRYSLPSGEERVLRKLPFLAAIIRIAPDGDKLAIGSEQTGEVEVRDCGTGQLLWAPSHPGRTYGLSWHPDGSLLATGCESGDIYLWDVASRQKRAVLQGHGRPPNGVWFSHDGNRLASGSWESTWRLWNVWTGRQLLTRPLGGAQGFSRDDSRAAMATAEMFEICQYTGRREFREFCSQADHSPGWQCAWSPDGRILASGHRRCLRLWIVASGQEIRLPFDDDVEAWGVAFDSAGKFLIAGTSAGLRCWSIVWEHLQDGDRLVLGHEERFGPVCSTGSVFVNGTGNVLATSCGNAFQVYEWPSRSHLRSLSMGTNAWPVWGGVLSPSGRLGLGWPFKPDQPRRAWDIATGSGLKDLPSAGIYGGAFTHDDRLLIAGSSDEYVAWDTHSWTNLWKLPRQNSGDTHAQVALARDGTLGALTLSAQTIRLFDTQTGREFATLEAPEPETLGGLAFSPDDSALAATTSSGSIHLWDLRLIRQELAAMNLDWDAPPLPPAQTTSAPLVIISTDSGHPPQHPAALQIPRRDPACSTNQIDLSKFYNASLLDSWFNPKWEQNNLAALPRGLQTMDGILFDIRGVVQLSSTHRDLAIAYPPQVESIPVQRNCRMLHFLQSAGFPYENGGEIGAYIIRYADGVQRSVPLIYGENIQDWWLTSGVSPVLKSGVAVGWRGQNPICASNGKDLLLFHLRWENPRPEAAIESITFRSGMTQCAPFLIAITTE